MPKLLKSKTTRRILVHQVEKQLGELGEQLPAELKSGIEAKVEAVKEALKADDLDGIKSASSELEASLQELAQAAQAAGAAARSRC